jgi:NADP-dependent 3-hydroxy acid dehydrogenase YdfG
MKDFKSKVAVVTGAASGIGLGIAKRCVLEGMRVVLADIEQVALNRAENELTAMGGTVLQVLTDVSKAGQVEALAKQTVETFGAAHLLFNNAGIGGASGSPWECTLSDWEWIMGVNFWGVLHGIRAFIPIMLSQNTECHVVNTASTAGLLAYHPGAGYQVTKHAVVALSENLYISLKQKGAKVKASVLCPGFVKTRIFSAARNQPAEFRNNSAAELLSPEEEEAAWANIIKHKFNVLSADQVADAVFTAIREERFYILTHPEFNKMASKRMEDIIQGKNPSVTPMTFEKSNL